MNLYVGFSVPNQPVPCGTNTSHLPGSCRGLQLLIIQQRSSGRHGHCLKLSKITKKPLVPWYPVLLNPARGRIVIWRIHVWYMDPVGNTNEKSIHLFWCFTIITIFEIFTGAPLKTAEVNICGSLSLAAAGGNALPHFETTKKVNNWKGPMFARGPQGCFLKYAV